VAILSELGDDTTLPVAYHNLGNMRQHLGEVDAAAAAYAEALAGYRAIGNRDGEGLTLSSLATLRRDQGHLAEAESVAREAMRLLDEIGEETSALMAGNTLGTVLLRLGRPAEAIELFQASADLARSRSLPRQWADGLVGIARARLATGELEAARAVADQALKLAEEHGMPLSRADTLLAQAEIEATTDPAGAVPTAEAALKLYQDAGAATAAAQARALLTELTDSAQSA
jgi:tetratricopeptide (TPR) repeat protein